MSSINMTIKATSTPTGILEVTLDGYQAEPD